MHSPQNAPQRDRTDRTRTGAQRAYARPARGGSRRRPTTRPSVHDTARYAAYARVDKRASRCSGFFRELRCFSPAHLLPGRPARGPQLGEDREEHQGPAAMFAQLCTPCWPRWTAGSKRICFLPSITGRVKGLLTGYSQQRSRGAAFYGMRGKCRIARCAGSKRGGRITGRRVTVGHWGYAEAKGACANRTMSEIVRFASLASNSNPRERRRMAE